MDTMAYYTQVAPILMVAVVALFGAVVAWAYWPKHRARFERDASIPLHDGD